MKTKPKRCIINHYILEKVRHAIVEIAGFVSMLHRLDAYSGMHLVFPFIGVLDVNGGGTVNLLQWFKRIGKRFWISTVSNCLPLLKGQFAI